MIDDDRRPATELVLIILATTVGLVVVSAVVLLGVLAIAHPETPPYAASAALASVLTVLVGVVVGYLAGRRTP